MDAVLLFSGISFAGYLAQRVTGAIGYPLAGALGGLVSSTGVTVSFARLSAANTKSAAALATGAIAASTVLFGRVATAVAILDRTLLPALAWYLAPPVAVGLVGLAVGWRSADGASAEPTPLRNPLQFRDAITMAALFQAVLFAVFYVQLWIGDRGLMASGFVLGLTDVDALTLSMTRIVGHVTIDLACRAIAMGIVANSLMKATIAMVLGQRRFKWQAGVTLLAMATAGVLALAF